MRSGTRYDAEGNRAATHGPNGDRYYLGPLEMRGGLFVHRVQVGGRTVAQAMRKDGDPNVEIAYVHDDHLGSTDLVTDKSGNVQARFSYDAWGARRDRAWTRAPEGPDGTPLVDHGYTGHEHDDEWGVIHMRGRAYDPAMRRMTSVDSFVVNPFGVQAFNRYSYVLNDPINHVDPSGFVCVQAGVLGTVCGSSITVHDFQTGDTVTGSGQSSEPVTTPTPAAPTQAEQPNPRASLPNLDAAVHRVTQIALNGLDQGTVWGNPSPTNVAGAINRFSSNPGLGAGEALAYTYVRGTLENVETASNANASTGDRAAASGWLLLDLLGAGAVGMLGKFGRVGAAVNQVDDAARAVGMVNSRAGFDLALGLGPRSALNSFASRFPSAMTYWDFFTDSFNVYSRVSQLMPNARAIRFSLDGLVEGGRGFPRTLREVFEFGADGAGVTNFEFYMVVTRHLAKTTFYRGGKVVQLVFDNGVPVG